jgi:hypothetical protein
MFQDSKNRKRRLLLLLRLLSLRVIAQREAVIANNKNENGHTFMINNKTRRKIAYKHMFRAVFGPGEKGIRLKLPECVDVGVRALFPDEQAQYMGFKEE